MDLLLTLAEVNQAATFKNQWRTGNPASPGVYERHTNSDTRTKKTRADVVKLIEDFTDFFSPLLVRMSGSAAITDGARLILRIAPPNPNRPRPRVPIDVIPVVSFHPLGSGDMKIGCRTGNDTKRPSLPEGADSVQIARQIGGTAPANADEAAMVREVFTRAEFTHKLGAAASGQKLYAFVRFYNTKHPELAGPWTLLQIVAI